MSHSLTTAHHSPDPATSMSRARSYVVMTKTLQGKLVAWLLERALRRAEADLQRLDEATLRYFGLSRPESRTMLRNH